MTGIKVDICTPPIWNITFLVRQQNLLSYGTEKTQYYVLPWALLFYSLKIKKFGLLNSMGNLEESVLYDPLTWQGQH